MPYQSIKTVIVDDDGKYIRDAKTNEIGAVAIGGPNVFKGYAEEAHNKNIWLPDGSFNTGDLGRIDEDGYVWLTGRKKELIIRGGHNIDPAIIEEAIYQMSDVKTVAAVGRPDPYAGEVPVAYVQMAEGSQVDAESIMQWAKQHVGEKAAIPKEIIITKEIPLTPVGKIFKPALRYDATRRAYEKALEGLEGMAESFEISVGEDKAHGTRADIKVKPNAKTKFTEVKKKIDELLAPYTIYYTVSEIK
jgi:fatty-acyl-CoA synthase